MQIRINSDAGPVGTLSDAGGRITAKGNAGRLLPLAKLYAEHLVETHGADPATATATDVLALMLRRMGNGTRVWAEPVASRQLSQVDQQQRLEHRLRVAAALAMIQHRLDSLEGKNPGGGDDQATWDAIAELADDPEELAKALGSVSLSWVSYGTSRGGRPRWKNTETKQLRYQTSQPGSATEARRRNAANTERGHAIIDSLGRHEATADDLRELSDHLPAMTAQHLRRARQKLGATFKNGRRRDAMVQALRDHVAGKAKEVEALTKRGGGATKRDDGTPEAPAVEDVHTVPTTSLKRDPSRFQYKVTGIGSEGVTEELKDVQKYDPALGGTLLVWRDPATGEDFVVNGHHRHHLAERTAAPTVNARYIQAPSAKEARAQGALANIAEGRGSAVDAAKYLRDSGQDVEHLRRSGVSLSGKVAADAAHLTKLNPKLFEAVAREEFPEASAVAIGKHLDDPALQDLLVKKVRAREEEGSGKQWGPREIEQAARKMAAAGKVKESGTDLFGDFEDERSTFDEEVELENHVGRALGQAVSDYGAVASTQRAGRVAGAGNVLATDENARRRDAARVDQETFDRLMHRSGPIAEAIKAGAVELANAKKESERKTIRAHTIERVKDAIRTVHNPPKPEAPKPGPGPEAPAPAVPAGPEAGPEAGGGALAPHTGGGVAGGGPEPGAAAAGGVGEVKPVELTRDEIARLLANPGDRYADVGHKRDELKGQHPVSGDPRYGYRYAPEHFVRSDATGAMIRHYVKLPNGQTVHPDELRDAIDRGRVTVKATDAERERADKVKAWREAIKNAHQFTRQQLTDMALAAGVSPAERSEVLREHRGDVARQIAADGHVPAAVRAEYPEAPPGPEEPAPLSTSGGTDLFGNKLPRNYGGGRRGAQLDITDAAKAAWTDRAKAWAGENGHQIASWDAGGRFKTADGRTFQVGRAEDGFPIAEVTPNPKVEYVRAPAGGATSDVDGVFYRGGQLMPIHGRYSGQEKPPPSPGLGTGGGEPAKEDDEEKEGGGGGRRRPAQPLTPEELAEERQRQADQQKWNEMKSGPMGPMKWFGDHPNRRALDRNVLGLKEWREYANEIGPAGVRHIIDTLEPRFHAALGDKDADDWYKNNAHRMAEESVGFFRGGKGHEKAVPGSHYARTLAQEMLEKQNSPGRSAVDIHHDLHRVLTEARNPPAPVKPAHGRYGDPHGKARPRAVRVIDNTSNNDGDKPSVPMVFGRALPENVVAALGSGQDGGHVVTSIEYGGGIVGGVAGDPQLWLGTDDDRVKATRVVRRHEDGNLYLHNASFEVKKNKDRGAGVGAQTFADQVRAARAAGIKGIETYAAGVGDTRAGFKQNPNDSFFMNGYYTWPRLGYDGVIPEHVYGDLPPDLQKQAGPDHSVLALMSTPKGREWWKENGDTFAAHFDLSDGSPSMMALDAYLRERAARDE